MNIRIRQLEAFLTIVEVGSMTAAVEELHLTQSTISKLLSRLESEIGFDLFDRIGKTLRLSDKGRQFLGQARQTLEAFEDMRKTAMDIRDDQGGRLRISAIGPLSAGPLVPNAVARLAQKFPDFTLSFDGRTRIEIEEWVAQGGANLGFTFLPISHSGLSAKELATVSACAVVPRDHPFAMRASLSPADLMGQSVVLPHSQTRIRNLVDANFISAGVRSAPRIETSSAISAVYLVSQGAGISVLDPFSCMSVPQDQVRLLRWTPDTPISYGMIHQSNRVLSEIENQFFDVVSQNIANYMRTLRSGFDLSDSGLPP